MAASNCQITTESRWANEVSFTGYASAKQADSSSKTVTPGSTCNRVFFESRTLVASGTYTYDLQALTDALGVAIVATKIFGLRIENSGNTLTIAPGAANGLVFYWSGTNPVITIKTGGTHAHCDPAATTVTALLKTLLFTNASGSSTTFQIEFLLGQ